MIGIKCAFVASYYGPYYSSFVASMISFYQGMKKKGYDVIFVFPEEAKAFSWISLLEQYDAKIYYVAYKPYSLNNIMSLRKVFKTEHINLVYSHMCGWDFTVRLANPFIPVIWHMRMYVNANTRLKRLKNWVKFKILGFGRTYHIASSKPVADVINSFNPKHRCAAIHNSLDFSRLHKTAYKSRIGKPAKVLLFGWAPYVKGLDVALDACEIINTESTSIQLHVSAQNETYRYLNERYFGKMPSWLVLLKPTDDVASLYNSVDVMLSASRSEGFSFSLAEAIYSGLPVIYSDIPGTNWANDFENTFPFKSTDAQDLIQAMKTCTNSVFTETSRTNNQRLMEEHYSINVWTEKVISFMEHI